MKISLTDIWLYIIGKDNSKGKFIAIASNIMISGRAIEIRIQIKRKKYIKKEKRLRAKSTIKRCPKNYD